MPKFIIEWGEAGELSYEVISAKHRAEAEAEAAQRAHEGQTLMAVYTALEYDPEVAHMLGLE